MDKNLLKNSLKKISNAKYSSNYKDGCNLKKNSVIFEISGNAKRYILSNERTVLNFIQHLSSISTHTKKFVEKIKKNSKTKLLDTRKTTTGLKVFRKIRNQDWWSTKS